MKKNDKAKQTVRIFGVSVLRWKDCPECKSKLSCEFRNYGYATRCTICQEKYDKAILSESPLNFVYKQHKDLTALVIDRKTGEPLWLDTKGRKVKYDSSEVRYDLRKDPHGWRSTGKRVKETDKYGNRL